MYLHKHKLLLVDWLQNRRYKKKGSGKVDSRVCLKMIVPYGGSSDVHTSNANISKSLNSFVVQLKCGSCGEETEHHQYITILVGFSFSLGQNFSVGHKCKKRLQVWCAT